MNKPKPACWISLDRIVRVLRHPDFYWGNIPRAKYLELRIDTRDNCALIMDRNGKPVTIEDLEAAAENPSMPGMNDNTNLSTPK
jgi:hypothetical protein